MSYESERFINDLLNYILDKEELFSDESIIFTQEIKKLTIIVNRGSLDLLTLLKVNIKLYALLKKFINDFKHNTEKDIDVFEKLKVDAAGLYLETLKFFCVSFEVVEFMSFIWLLKYFFEHFDKNSIQSMQNEIELLLERLFKFQDEKDTKLAQVATYLRSDVFYQKLLDFYLFFDVKVFKLMTHINMFISQYNKTEANFDFYKFKSQKRKAVEKRVKFGSEKPEKPKANNFMNRFKLMTESVFSNKLTRLFKPAVKKKAKKLKRVEKFHDTNQNYLLYLKYLKTIDKIYGKESNFLSLRLRVLENIGMFIERCSVHFSADEYKLIKCFDGDVLSYETNVTSKEKLHSQVNYIIGALTTNEKRLDNRMHMGLNIRLLELKNILIKMINVLRKASDNNRIKLVQNLISNFELDMIFTKLLKLKCVFNTQTEALKYLVEFLLWMVKDNKNVADKLLSLLKDILDLSEKEIAINELVIEVLMQTSDKFSVDAVLSFCIDKLNFYLLEEKVLENDNLGGLETCYDLLKLVSMIYYEVN